MEQEELRWPPFPGSRIVWHLPMQLFVQRLLPLLLQLCSPLFRPRLRVIFVGIVLLDHRRAVVRPSTASGGRRGLLLFASAPLAELDIRPDVYFRGGIRLATPLAHLLFFKVSASLHRHFDAFLVRFIVWQLNFLASLLRRLPASWGAIPPPARRLLLLPQKSALRSHLALGHIRNLTIIRRFGIRFVHVSLVLPLRPLPAPSLLHWYRLLLDAALRTIAGIRVAVHPCENQRLRWLLLLFVHFWLEISLNIVN